MGFCPGRLYDENVSIVRQTIHDVNNNRRVDGGMLLFLDNEKAFDRLQHTVAFPLRENSLALMVLTRATSGPVVVDGESFLDALFASAGQG